MERTNAPHTFCASSHTHKEDFKTLPSTPKGVEGASTPPGPAPGDGSSEEAEGSQKGSQKLQGGTYWTSVETAIEQHQEAQLLKEQEEPSPPSEQLPLFDPYSTPQKP